MSSGKVKYKSRTDLIMEKAKSVNIQNKIFTENEFDSMPIYFCGNSQECELEQTNGSPKELLFVNEIQENVENIGNDNIIDTELEQLFTNISDEMILSTEELDCESQSLDSFSSYKESNNVKKTPVDLIPQIKLVDYDSSSSENGQAVNNINRKSIPLLFGERIISSDYSVASDPIQSDSSRSEENEDSVVGKKGLRKKKELSKKTKRKLENNLGKGKSVQVNPCKAACQHNCGRKFKETVRHEIHELYWGLGNYERQRSWLLSCVKKVPIKRRKQEACQSRRQNSFKYYINWNDEELEVCQQFLLTTLNISQMTMRYLVTKAVQKSVKVDGRGKHRPHNKTSEAHKNMVHEFIMKLPAVPSHYCRNKTSRKYLSSELRNVSFLYTIFKRDQEELHNRKTVVSLKVFRDIFKRDFNLGFHLPKKDKCKTCESREDTGFQETEKSQQVYNEHIKNKEKCKSLFLTDQKKTNSEVLCASFDMQKVLNTPHGDNLLLYYSRKYSFYNETVYESGLQNGFCFLWGESDGNRGCNEICSIINKYLKDVDERGFKEVILYCDSCTGQNKNRAMLNMLHIFVQETSKNVNKIRIVFLLPGHTYMPVDSVHATIERFLKRRIIWAPSEWDTIIANSRTKPKHFKTIRMQYNEFFDWKKLGAAAIPPSTTKTVEGEKFKISEMKQAVVEKGNPQISINYNYEDGELHFLELNQEATDSRKSGKFNIKYNGVVCDLI